MRHTQRSSSTRTPVNKTLTVQAGPSVNNYNNSSNPIVIRLYQLNSRSEFEAAGFWQIFNGGAPELAGVVVNVRSLSPLYPGENRLVSIDLEPDVFYLGAFAEFADFSTQQFRHVVPINEKLFRRWGDCFGHSIRDFTSISWCPRSRKKNSGCGASQTWFLRQVN